MVSHGGDPKEIAEREGLLQQSDESALKVIVDQVIEQNENVVAEYKAGKEASLQFLVGQGMKISKGSANPGLLAKLLKEKLL
jgi:aspartyl-tRNA(Asn)/glutamyl-tRNA(Gln) amidotransferase subunit B